MALISILCQKPIQDAIRACENLRFKYIWIDSLCIIQDDESDWMQESLKMSSVYSNSALNFAATSALDGRAGLFFKRNPASAQHCNVKMPSRAVSSCFLVHDRIWEQNVEESPLVRRAWVVQERFMAPRTLHFTSRQLFCECNELSACESFPKGVKTPWRSGFKLKESPAETWQSLLRIYTKALLTKEEDKLIAISGIAKGFYSLTGDQYLAGMWRRDIE
jgi:Heterokaryon incompatibility protein (HET)